MGFEEIYDRLRTCVGLIFSPIPLPPIAWTFLAILLAIVGFYEMTQLLVGWAFWLFVASGVVDIIDGGVARVRKGESAFGAWIDDTADRMREMLLFIGLLFIIPQSHYLWVVLLIVLTFAIDHLKLHGLYRRLISHEETEGAPGRLERIERVVLVLGGMAICSSADCLMYAVWLALFLATLRVLQAVGYIYPKREVRERVRSLRRMMR